MRGKPGRYLTRRFSLPEEVLAGLGIAALAFALRFALDPVLASLLPFTVAMVATSLAALLVGWRCAVVHAMVSFLLVRYFFVAPRHVMTLVDTMHYAVLASYIVLSSVLIYAGYRARRAEIELARANEELRKDDAAKDRFLLGLAHELRGPLQVVLNSCALMRSGGELPPGLAENMRLIDRQVRGADRIVEDLLDMERVRRGNLSLKLAPVDIRVCVEESLQRCEAAISASGQRLTVAMPATPAVACVDRQRLIQVVCNLLENAAKYAGANATVSVSVQEDAHEVRLAVRDDGAGQSADVLAALMDGHTSIGIAPGGLGVGLRLCAKLVAAQHGRFRVGSEKGQGFMAELAFERFVVPGATEPAHRVAVTG
jgi:signal transduction histidine kinase